MNNKRQREARTCDVPALRFIEMLILYLKLVRGRGKFFRKRIRGLRHENQLGRLTWSPGKGWSWTQTRV